LLGEVRRAKHRHAANLGAVEELARDEARLDGLADPCVVSDQHPHGIEPQGHHERHELVRTRLDAEARERAEGTGRGAEPEADSVAEEPGAEWAAQIPLRARGRERRRDDLFERSARAAFPDVNTGDLAVAAAERTKDEQIVCRLRQDDPLSPARADQRTRGEAHPDLTSPRGALFVAYFT
jgi:hypothetical protein